MKRKFITPLSLLTLWLLLVAFFITALTLFSIDAEESFRLNPDESHVSDIIILSLYSVLTPISIICLIFNLQFATIDEEGIEVRNCFKRIQYKNWKDIKKITSVAVVLPLKLGPNIGYYFLQDDRPADAKTNYPNTMVSKYTYIKLPRRLKIRAIIEEYYHGPFEDNT